MFRKWGNYIKFTSALFLIMLLVSCAEKESGISQDPSGEEKNTIAPVATERPTEIPVKREPATLLFYSTAGWTEEAFNERFGDAMRKKFPEYTVEYVTTGTGTSLPEMIASGVEIDVYWQASDLAINHMLEYNLYFDMSDLIKKHGLDLSELEASSMKNIREQSNGNIYALPLVINSAGFYYNKDIFDKFGVDAPRDGVSWDELIELGRVFYREDGGKQYHGIGFNFRQVTDMNAFSIPYVDPATEKPTILTDERWRTIYDTLMRASQLTAGGNTATSFWVEQNVAMYAALANLFLNVDMTSFDWDIVQYPTFAGQDPSVGPQPYPTLFGITSMSKHKDAAMELLKHMLSEEEQLSLSQRGIIPVLQNDKVMQAFGSESVYGNKNFQAIVNTNFSPMIPRPPYAAASATRYAAPMKSLALGEMDLNTAFRQIDEAMTQMITEEKEKMN